MSVNTDYLKAFLLTYETGSFTQAAQKLGLSQSALSQKIARLEDQLESALFIRKSDGIELTSSGHKLLIFSKQQLKLEEEFLGDFFHQQGLAGTIRIAAYSSILCSIIIPKLSNFMKKHPKIKIEFSSHEVKDLESILKTNQADIVILDYFTQISGVEELKIGVEEFVMIENSKEKCLDIFLDHGPHDNATESFFKYQGEDKLPNRNYMGDVYGILEGVSKGLGKAVMSKHLVDADKRFKIIKTKKRYLRPIVLNYYKQNYYSKLQLKVIDELQC